MNFNNGSFSIQVQNAFDSFFIDAYEKGLKFNMKEVSDELGVSQSTLKRYIAYCSGNYEKTVVLRCMMCTLNFQQKYLERQAEIEKLKQKKNAMLAAKKLYERQQEKKEKNK